MDPVHIETLPKININSFFDLVKAIQDKLGMEHIDC
jgi:hypothetical protein